MWGSTSEGALGEGAGGGDGEEARGAGVDDFVLSLVGGTWELCIDKVMPRLSGG